MRVHNSPDNITGFAKMNDMYKAATEDIQVMLTTLLLLHWQNELMSYELNTIVATIK